MLTNYDGLFLGILAIIYDNEEADTNHPASAEANT